MLLSVALGSIVQPAKMQMLGVRADAYYTVRMRQHLLRWYARMNLSMRMHLSCAAVVLHCCARVVVDGAVCAYITLQQSCNMPHALHVCY